MTFTPVAERLAVKLSLPALTTQVSPDIESNPDLPRNYDLQYINTYINTYSMTTLGHAGKPLYCWQIVGVGLMT